MCSTCTVLNEMRVSVCSICKTKRSSSPGTKHVRTSCMTLLAESTDSASPPAKWRCAVCLVDNDLATSKCGECAAVQPSGTRGCLISQLLCRSAGLSGNDKPSRASDKHGIVKPHRSSNRFAAFSCSHAQPLASRDAMTDDDNEEIDFCTVR